ncbi:MAG: hypothetical protein K8S54_11960 [Spirochaetia bacterium]|nr:hypothetical protein [Spirochaetia bacterium]
MNRIRIIRMSLTAVAVVFIAMLATLFIFPTRDTQAESREIVSRARQTYFNFAYDDQKLAAGEGAEITSAEMSMLDQINPRTGLKFTESEIRRLSLLRHKFPGNELIPRVKTPDELRKDREVEETMREIAVRFNSGGASRTDIDGYFDRKTKLLSDWVQLLELVVNEEDWSPQVRGKYARMLAHTEKMRAHLESQRTTMLKRNGF